uniref:(northern house mosquito) hypothetical protein n=1 Tax=Culex pipiens TaxID=7175 RepID=A0A8D8AAY4_CULPI
MLYQGTSFSYLENTMKDIDYGLKISNYADIEIRASEADAQRMPDILTAVSTRSPTTVRYMLETDQYVGRLAQKSGNVRNVLTDEKGKAPSSLLNASMLQRTPYRFKCRC